MLDLLATSNDLRARLRSNTELFRARLTRLGFDILSGDHPIVPVILCDAVAATRLASRLLDKGFYVLAFPYPLLRQGAGWIIVLWSSTPPINGQVPRSPKRHARPPRTPTPPGASGSPR